MSRVVIIGAGASIDASQSKLPSATNFFRCVRNHPELSSELESLHVREALESLLPLSLSDPSSLKVLDRLNIEDVFTLASLEAEMDANDKRLWYLTELIRKTIVTCSREVKNGGNYSTFVKEMLDNQTSLISFNWDTLLDQALPDYCAPGRELDLPSEVPDLDILPGLHCEYRRICIGDTLFDSFYQDRPAPVRNLEAKPAYLKLHGSVDAVICKNERCRNYMAPFRVAHCTDHHYCRECYERVAPFIVPPIQNKPIRQLHHIRRAWMLACKLIQQAEEVIVWGYSLPGTDYWSRWLMGHVWGPEANCRKLVIINPQAAGFSRRKKRAGPRMHFIERFYPWKDLSLRPIEVEAYEFYDRYLKGENVMLR